MTEQIQELYKNEKMPSFEKIFYDNEKSNCIYDIGEIKIPSFEEFLSNDKKSHCKYYGCMKQILYYKMEYCNEHYDKFIKDINKYNRYKTQVIKCNLKRTKSMMKQLQDIEYNIKIENINKKIKKEVEEEIEKLLKNIDN
jgi:hypothetical protein